MAYCIKIGFENHNRHSYAHTHIDNYRVEQRHILNTKHYVKDIDVYIYEHKGVTFYRCKLIDIKKLIGITDGLNEKAFNVAYLGNDHEYHSFGRDCSKITGKPLIPYEKISLLLKKVSMGVTHYNDEIVKKCRNIYDSNSIYEQPPLMQISTVNTEPMAEQPIIQTPKPLAIKPMKIIDCDYNHDEIINHYASMGVLCEIYTTENTVKFINGENPKPIDNRRELEHLGF